MGGGGGCRRRAISSPNAYNMSIYMFIYITLISAVLVGTRLGGGGGSRRRAISSPNAPFRLVGGTPPPGEGWGGGLRVMGADLGVTASMSWCG